MQKLRKHALQTKEKRDEKQREKDARIKSEREEQARLGVAYKVSLDAHIYCVYSDPCDRSATW